MAESNDLNWDDLRFFLRAAQMKTLAGAARSMKVEHTTIGRRLSALERSIGVALVLRGPEGLALTALGEKILPLVLEVEREIGAIRELVSSQRERVRIALPSGFTSLLTDDLARLRDEHPGLTLETLSGGRQVDLRRGEADLAIRVGPVTDADLVVRRLGEIGWSLYAAKTYLARRAPPADPDNLAGHDLIGYGGEIAVLPAAKWIEEHSRGATIALRSNEISTMVTAALSGTGIALIPCFLVDDEPALQRLTPKVLATRELSLVYRRESRLAEPVRVVLRFVVEVMKEHVEWIRGTGRRDSDS